MRSWSKEQHQQLTRLRELAYIRRELNQIKAICALDRKYNPEQPRVPAGNSDGGQWTSDDASESLPSILDDGLSSFAAMTIRDECEQQYRSDVFHCRMVGLPACYAQAMVRKVACERGFPIPPLNY